MYIPRRAQETVQKLMLPGKVVVLYGARRVGKTTLLERLLRDLDEPVLSVTGEDVAVRDYLSSGSLEKLRSFVGERRVLAVDEAHTIPQIGLNLKLLIDHVPGLRILATGSSSLGLQGVTGEPLTGRQFKLRLFPFSQEELRSVAAEHELRARLETRLVYGSYPEVVLAGDDELRVRLLQELVSSYLLRDLLAFEGVRETDKLLRLLRLVALQVGAEVSTSELGRQLGLSRNTVERYLGLLEEAFVLVRLGGFSRNLRKEVARSSRYFFVDNGIRNALLSNFAPLELRQDVSALWENFVVVERIKHTDRLAPRPNLYFWRTYDQQEIDLVEEHGGHLAAYEIKWSPGKGRRPKAWAKAYPEASFQVINRANYLAFVAE